jgi:hypothetical protein
MQNINASTEKILGLALLMNYDQRNVSHDVTWQTFFFVNSFEGRNYVPSSSDKAHYKDKRSSYKESWKEMTRATFYRRKASSHVCMLPAVSCSSPTLLTLMIAK